MKVFFKLNCLKQISCKSDHKQASFWRFTIMKCWAGNQNQRTSGPVNAHLTPGPGIYFNAFIYVYSPRAGADNPLGTNVDVNRKPLSFCPFVAGLKKCFEVRFLYTFFSYFTIWATNKMACAPSKDSDRPGHPASLIRVIAVSMKKAWVLSYPLTA